MYEVKAFHCSHCTKYSTSRSLITKHEKECFKNPDTRSCGTCANLYEINHDIDIDFSGLTKYPGCKAGILFVKDSNNRKYKLKTLCPRWIEKSDE